MHCKISHKQIAEKNIIHLFLWNIDKPVYKTTPFIHWNTWTVSVHISQPIYKMNQMNCHPQLSSPTTVMYSIANIPEGMSL